MTTTEEQAEAVMTSPLFDGLVIETGFNPLAAYVPTDEQPTTAQLRNAKRIHNQVCKDIFHPDRKGTP